ncbi:hypothetical protein [Nocardioides sp.]|uniref:hypothetical protein n=1 Tax=Nocardioides sp. TaxID=35761 RepID=UPI001A337A81|nr:hypothetical protein [Nocardioides sp.]MBJ7358450.1 hypothetical protein [Nocardioides sp.]
MTDPMTDPGSDLQLRRRMTALVDARALPRGDVGDDLGRGRRSLVRRRLAAAAGAVAAVSAGALTAATLAWPGTSVPPVSEDPDRALSDEAILDGCQRLGRGILADRHWGDGVRLLTASSSAGKARAVLVSGDGERWADCWLRGDDGTGPGWVATYPMTGDRPGVLYEFRPGEHGPDDGVYSFLERFPSDVASVTVRFDSGEVRDVPAVAGFVVLQADGLEPGVNIDWVRLYDAAGELVAGPGMGPGDADLPPDYRTLVPREPIASVGVDGW